ncbi:MerR family transcriptional regulator [Gottschalkia acidurici]|uniref:MerR family transcriptional regulator n=1 Tax=Clostridium acidurici TaxID=1556 RepID=UPI003083FFA0
MGEAARLSGLTIETLRHYDRIGLLKPAKINEQSGYRYYTDEELIYLEVISFCRKNNMSLTEIKNIFQEDFAYTISFLKETEQKIDKEINRLRQTKNKY